MDGRVVLNGFVSVVSRHAAARQSALQPGQQIPCVLHETVVLIPEPENEVRGGPASGQLVVKVIDQGLAFQAHQKVRVIIEPAE